MDSLRFRSRIDAWVPLVFFGPVILALALIVAEYRVAPAASLAVAGAVCVGIFALFVWLVLGTSYEVTATELVVRSGPIRAAIAISAIRKVRRSSTILAGPALSLHRLEIDHGRYDTAIVSPRDIDGFVAALVSRNPAIDASPALGG